ncbi:ATP-binding protein [Novosphingobium piscinae]|uniref:histidine kinase n=1 Tax=Novosphingobium piscinae TaxID=1507448 RepID=A0A7X1FVW2_9SPHN|nr:PAS domain-containing sensor histidine kinase [Novosphingobium piscinae]MBC2667955.1 response regulator [Novosphingobium piscinae]
MTDRAARFATPAPASAAAAPARTGVLRDGVLVAGGFVASLAALWLVSGEPLVTAGFGGGAAALGGLGWVLARRRPAEPEPEWALPDWTVTVAAIDNDERAVAIIDRAGRLVCANATYERWFGIANPPPRLPVDPAATEVLARTARAAWRDGRAAAETVAAGERVWRAEVHRAGRGEDFLVWHLAEVTRPDPVAELGRAIEGKLGRALAVAGISAAIVTPEGEIRAASEGLALRATGDAGADLRGQSFVALLRQDDADRITWAREGREGQPLVLYYVPVADPDSGVAPDPDHTPSLMLLADAGIGIGAASAQGDGQAAVPHLEALLAQLPLGLAMADRDGRLLFANAAFLRAAGRAGEEPPPFPSDLVVREDKGALSDAVRRHAQGPASAGDIAVRLKFQPDEPVSLSLAGVRGLGEAAVLLGLSDSTEETRLKRQVAQASKMQAVGQLAGGVAHDFNNVLTAILGTCDLMLLRHTPGDSDYDDIQQIRASSNRAASLTRQLLAFSRQQTLRPEVLQLPDIVSDITQMLKRLIGEKIRFEVRHDRDLGAVRADPTQLEQVIVNLVVNARDALADKADGSARLTITTRRMKASDVRSRGGEILPQGDYTALIVEDTGSGIAPEHLSKIFEPFFTTKEQGRGTGLGLSTVYGIVKQSGGYIFADSEVGKGTCFSIYFPVHHGPAASSGGAQLAARTEEPRKWAGGGKILLVEDEDTVRAVAERALTRQGYEVTVAADGEEGLQFVALGRRYDLVVSDVVMPVMDGPAMAREIRKIVPSVPFLFMSGYAEEQLRKEIDFDNMHFMPKPFTVQQITDTVAQVLGAVKG